MSSPRWIATIARLLCIALHLLFVASTTLANSAPWEQPADIAAEPSATMRGIVIERELLEIDLRPIETRHAAEVSATYTIRNVGARRRIDLRFVLGSELARFDHPGSVGYRVELDGRRVDSVGIDSIDVPREWLPRGTTPSLDGGAPHPYHLAIGTWSIYDADRETALALQPRPRVGAIAFAVDLDGGVHRLTVRYQTVPAAAGSPVLLWQLAYILSPARNWGGFGRLDARVLLPAGWDAATDPPMRRSGDTLVGSWQGIPADDLAITARVSTPFWLPDAVTWGTLLALVISGAAGQALGRRMWRRGTAWDARALVAFLLGVAAAVLVSCVATYCDWLRRSILEAQFESDGYIGIGIFFLYAPAAAVMTILATRFGYRTRTQRSDDDTVRAK